MPFRGLALQSLLLAVLVTWPALLHPTTEILGSPKGDAVKHVWNLWWMHHELWQGEWGLKTTLINFPTGLDLYPIEIANGMVTAWWPLPPVLTANLLAFVHVVLTGLCTGLLGWRVTRTAMSAHVAGAIAQGCAFTAFTLHAGVGELRQAWWIPLGLAAAIGARDSLRVRDFVVLGLTLAAATLACFYHGFFLATAVAVYALCTPARSRALWFGWALAAGLSLLIVVPIVKVFASAYGTENPAHAAGFVAWMRSGLPTESFQVTSLQLHELILPDRTLTTDFARPFEAYLGGRYVGVFTILLGALGLAAAPRRTWPWALVVLTGIVLALGNTLWLGGHLVQPIVVLPLALLNKLLGYIAEPLNFPVRYLAISSTALAVLAGSASRWRWTLVLVPLALLDVAWNDPVPFPRSTFKLDSVDDVQAPPGAVAELTWATSQDAVLNPQDPVTLFDGRLRTRSIAAQMFLDRPFQTIAIERVDHWAFDGVVWTAALPLSRALAGTAMTEDDLQSAAYLLKERGFGSVLLTRPCDGLGDLKSVALLSAVLGPPRRGACFDVWPIGDVAAPDDLEAFRARFAVDLSKVRSPNLGPPVDTSHQ
ncbi:hypothetical protein LBMAG42_40690 [Deltaproteobacteria bacterium]|nr:hypothetical protein LBMAG42_40690 [Deltaproteobacteria bacterium]